MLRLFDLHNMSEESRVRKEDERHQFLGHRSTPKGAGKSPLRAIEVSENLQISKQNEF